MNKIQSFLENNIPSIVLICEKNEIGSSKEIWHFLMDTPLFPVKVSGIFNNNFNPETLTLSLFPDNYESRYAFTLNSSFNLETSCLKKNNELIFDSYNEKWEKIKSSTYKDIDEGILNTKVTSDLNKKTESFKLNGVITSQKIYIGKELVSWQKKEQRNEIYHEKSFSRGYLSGKRELILENDLIKEIKTFHSDKMTEWSLLKYFFNKNNEWNICIQQGQIPLRGSSILFKRYLFNQYLVLSDQENLPDSRFTKIEKNNNYFFGEITKGYFEGIGLYRFGGESIYLGNFKKNKYNGWGLWIHQNGSLLCGLFSDGYLNGKGFCFNTAKQFMYEGNFLNGQFDGQGKLYLPGGDLYHALFHKNKRSNQGIKKKHPIIFQ